MSVPDNFMPGLKVAIEKARNPDVEESIRWHNEMWRRMHMICTLPPAGWRCTRELGHEGPCAAVPINVLTIIVVWQDFPKHETTIYKLENVPGPVLVDLRYCHGRIDSSGSDMSFMRVHQYLASKEDCRIDSVYEGQALVIVSGIS